MIPSDKQTAVLRAVQTAFGPTATMDDVQQITRGLSQDLVFRITVQGSPFLLRLMTRSNEHNDPERIYANMRIAADGGIAPRVRYASTADGVSITDFIAAVPFPLDLARREMPLLLRRLHALPRFPRTFNYATMHRMFVTRFRAAGLLPENELHTAFDAYHRIAAAYPLIDQDLVSSHSDLKPENILYDGTRVWLVDWEAAFVNDRYYDLAVVANFAADASFLHHYWTRPATQHEQARFYLMRQTLHFLYGVVFLSLGQPTDSEPYSFEAFHTRIWNGDVDLSNGTARTQYGQVHWRQFLRNTQTARFAEALQIVADAYPNSARLLPR